MVKKKKFSLLQSPDVAIPGSHGSDSGSYPEPAESITQADNIFSFN
jgi:hypothetical protein